MCSQNFELLNLVLLSYYEALKLDCKEQAISQQQKHKVFPKPTQLNNQLLTSSKTYLLLLKLMNFVSQTRLHLFVAPNNRFYLSQILRS